MSRLREIVDAQKLHFQKGITRDVEFRIMQLKLLAKVIRDNEDALLTAIQKDINRPTFESFITELGLVYKEIDHVCKHLKQWTKPVSVKSDKLLFGSKSYYLHEPKGVVLVMAPWSFPVQLTLMPLVAAIAAGNCVVLKPSEQTAEVSSCIEKMIHNNFKEEYIRVIRGDRQINMDLLQIRFDHIFFSGSSLVGKKVMKAAAEHLTPITLELGGKNPCVVDRTADLDIAAKRIVWGKFMSAGQTCTAPDYLLIDSYIKNEFITKLVDETELQFGSMIDKGRYTKIISRQQLERLEKFLVEVNVVYGGQVNKLTNTFVPTIVDNVKHTHALQDQEIFGPILPVFEFDSIKDAIDTILKKEKPLAFYLFSSDEDLQARFIEAIPFGGGCINDTTLQAFNYNLPFGGTGQSGIGKYHGRFGVEEFSNRKSIVKRGWKGDPGFRYPPYNDKKLSLLKQLMK